MPELADIVSRLSGSAIRFDSISEAEYADICRDGNEEVSEYLIAALTSIYRAVDNGEFAQVSSDIELLTGSTAEDAESWLRKNVSV